MPIERVEASNESMSTERVEATLDRFEKIRGKAMELYKRNIDVIQNWERLLADELAKPPNKQDARLIAKVRAKVVEAEHVEKQLDDIIMDAFEKLNAIEGMLLDLIDKT